MIKTVLVTGAGGFIGRRLVRALADADYSVRCTYRRLRDNVELQSCTGHDGPQRIELDLEDPQVEPAPVVQGVDAVIHLAAHVHVGGLSRPFSAGRYRRINVEGTQRLADAAVSAGVRRFILLSSIGVNGPRTGGSGAPERFRESDQPAPANAYTRSKLAAENRLRESCAGAAMEYVVLRAPLVFGPGNGGNFLRLMRLLSTGVPLPLAGVRAERSLVYVDNLVDVIALCLTSDEAGNRLFLVSDGDLAVRDLARRLAAALESRARLWDCPAWLLEAGRCVPVAGTALRSLTWPLLVDSSRLRAALHWQPRIDFDEALRETGRWYLARREGQG